MQTGVINAENISSVLRQISQSRKQGVLEIAGGDQQLLLSFVAGKIVDAVKPTELPLLGVAQRLAGGEKLAIDPEEFLANLDAGSKYKDLFLALNESPDGTACMEEEEYRAVIMHEVLDSLYELELGAGAYYKFKIQMVDCDRDFCPSFSVGQILLDLVALDTEWPRFEEVFLGGGVLSLTGVEPGSLSGDEQLVVDVLDRSLGLSEVRERTMLSRFHFMEALLELHDQGVIVVREAGAAMQEEQAATQLESQSAPKDPSEMSMVDDLVAALEDSIDASFSEEAFADLLDDESEPPQMNGSVQAKEETPGEAFEEDVEEEYEEYEDNEYEEGEFEQDFRVRLNVLNMKLLHSQVVPQILVFAFFAAALLIPLFTWGTFLSPFSGR